MELESKTQMNTIRLYGALGQEFGASHRFEITSPGEAFQALAANFPRFIDKLRHGFYRVRVAAKGQSKGIDLDETTILQYRIGDHDIHVLPVIAGRGRGGLGKVLAGTRCACQIASTRARNARHDANRPTAAQRG